MTKNPCLEDACDTTSVARGLCNKHYMFHRNHGTLDQFYAPAQHRITDIDSTTKLGSCSICGVETKLLNYGDKQWRCANQVKSVKRNTLTYGGGQVIPRSVVNTAFRELTDIQGGLCAVCGKSCEVNAVLSVDHCHTTGKIRGLLCNKCNTGIGLLGDNIEGVQAALDYLKASIA